MRSRGLPAAAMVLAATTAAAELVERVVAVVDGRALCLSDVRAVERLDGIGRDTALARLVDESLLFQEAFRLPQAAFAAGAVSAEDPAVQRARHRRAVIERYVDFRFRPQVRVEDDAVRQAYAQQAESRADGPDFETAAAALRERLVAAEVARRVEEWLRDLRATARIRYNAD